MVIVDDNQVYVADDADYPFKNNFIDTPWDDRSKNSKFGIITLLVAIAAVIVICVCNSFMMHYAIGHPKWKMDSTCPLINVYEKKNYNFVARVYSLSNKLLCVGAVVSPNTVLADEICIRGGPVILVVGTSADPRCKKGFTVNTEEIIEFDHDGILSKKLIIVETKNSFGKCGTPIAIGSNISLKSPAYIIGRPFTQSGRGLTKQPVTVSGRGSCKVPETLQTKLDTKMMICVKDFGRCQVHAGDLLVQGGKLHGLASFGVRRTDTVAYFADLTKTQFEYKKLFMKMGK